MSRCWGCCQENCGYHCCTCSCHKPEDVTWPEPKVLKIEELLSVIPDEVPKETKCPCKKHRRYQAKRKPQVNCEACWRYYVKVNP